MKIFIDFDGVIINHKNFPTRKDWWNDKPMKGAKEVIEFWFKKDTPSLMAGVIPTHKIKIFTARHPEEWGKIREWLNKYEFPQIEITNIKEEGVDVFIDDRAIRFTNWLDISKYFR